MVLLVRSKRYNTWSTLKGGGIRAVGMAEGTVEGISLGDEEGMHEGTAEGVKLGDEDGMAEGSTDGTFEGI